MRVAFGKVVLTPPESLGGYLGRTLAGYTPVQICSGKYDDIYAHAVLIEETELGNVKKRMMFISLDYLKVPLLWTDYVKERIEKRYRIHRNQIMIHAIHTHKSIDMCGEFSFKGGLPAVIKGIMFGSYYADDKYRVWVAKQLEELTGKLIENLRPAKVAWTRRVINEPILVNRRDPLRRTKGDLGVIVFKDAENGDHIGTMVTFNMHPTTLANFIDKLSADYPGRVIAKIEELSGGKMEAAFFTGPAGDINPITTMGTDFEFLASQPQDYLLNQKGTYKHTCKLGYFIGEKAYETVTSIPDDRYFDTVHFKIYANTFWVPMKDFTAYKSKAKLNQRLVFLIKRYLLFPIALIMGDAHEPNFPGFAVKHKGIFRPSAKINVYSMVHYFRWFCSDSEGKKEPKELAVVGVPGELFEDIGKEIREKTPAGFENTFIFQNANDWISYLFPLKEYMEKGGYEPFASFSPYSGEYVKFAYFRLLKDLEAGTVAGYY